MSEAEAAARAALSAWRDPYIGQSLAEMRALRALAVTSTEVHLGLRLPVPSGGYAAELRTSLEAVLRGAGMTQALVLDLSHEIPTHAVQRPLKPLPGIRNIVAVGSAKGGVGKSTVAANLAAAWVAAGARVGLLDADVYGPSQPMLFGVREKPETRDNKQIIPLTVAGGLKLMSIGLLIDAGQAAIWRGPMVTQALMQLLTGTDWGELDYLVLDLPPGTGDLQLTLAQRVPVAGSVVVTTPQQIAVADARKGLAMFEKMSIGILGVVENMSTHLCSHCGHEDAIFGSAGGERLAADAGVPLLAKLPLDTRIGAESDAGTPTVLAAPDTARARAYVELARHTAGQLARRPRDRGGAFPGVVVERAS
ncbi:MAG: iron-sulfur cluster carrier protein ApbC [Steroidobacteraceae bacterium]